jgi:hypothetical protein
MKGETRRAPLIVSLLMEAHPRAPIIIALPFAVPNRPVCSIICLAVFSEAADQGICLEFESL